MLIVSLALTIPLSPSQYVAVGDTSNFIVKKASGSFKYIVDSTFIEGNTSKFRVGNTGVWKDSILEVKIKTLESTSLSYDISTNEPKLTTATSSALG